MIVFRLNTNKNLLAMCEKPELLKQKVTLLLLMVLKRAKQITL